MDSINKALILAGGLGTRLKSISAGKPKPMMDINGRPFLAYILDHLILYNITDVILAVSYHWQEIYQYFGKTYKTLKLDYAIEEKPLGTGGAVLNALNTFDFPENMLILNGDTYFSIDLDEFVNFHQSKKSNLSLALSYQENISRYGKVSVDNENNILSFTEKDPDANTEGFINGGIYLINKELLLSTTSQLFSPHTAFSLEKEIFPQFLSKHYGITGFTSSAYFIDIGIPEDYEKAVKTLV